MTEFSSLLSARHGRGDCVHTVEIGASHSRRDIALIMLSGVFHIESLEKNSPNPNKAVRDGVPLPELVNGCRLVKMLEHLEMGLKPKKTYEVDMTFFEESKADFI